MTLTNKILVALLALTIIGSAIFVVYKMHQLNQAQEEIKNSLIEQKQLQDQIMRSQSQYVNKDDFIKFANQHNIDIKDIQKDLDNLGGKIDGLNVFTANSNSQNGANVPSTSTQPSANPQQPPTVECNGQQIPCPNADKYGYAANIQSLKLSEQFKDLQVPFGSVSFDASQEKPWSYTVPERKYTVNTVIGHTVSGQAVVYNQLQITAGDDQKSYKIPIDSSQFVEQYPEPSFNFLKPKLFLGIGAGANISEIPIKGELTPKITLGLISYGKTAINPDLSIAEIGIGYQTVSKRPSLEINPIQVNIGNVFGTKTLLNNTYAGPNVSVNTAGQVGVGLTLGVGL